MTASNNAVMWWHRISHDKHQTQFCIWSGPGAFIGCVLLRESKVRGLVKEESGELRYVAAGFISLGKGSSGASPRSHGAVATQVALKSAAAFSSFEMHREPSGLMRVVMRGLGLGPDAYFFALKRVSTVSVDK